MKRFACVLACILLAVMAVCVLQSAMLLSSNFLPEGTQTVFKQPSNVKQYGCDVCDSCNLVNADVNKLSANLVGNGQSNLMTSNLDKGYNVQNLVMDNKYVGARFSGNYFVNDNLSAVVDMPYLTGIAVYVDLYSSQNLTINSKLDFADNSNAVVQKTNNLFEQIDKIIVQVDNSTNPLYNGQNNLPLSDVYKYNAATCGQKIEITQDTYRLLQIAQEMYSQTNGAFNPCLYRLVDLWGFSSRVYSYGLTSGSYSEPYDRQNYNQSLPQEKYVSAFMQQDFVDFSTKAVSLSEQDGKYYVTKNVRPAVVEVDGVQVEFEQWLDLGGIAKGYVADKIAMLLQENNLENYYVSVGESSSQMGKFVDGKEHIIAQQDAFNPALSTIKYPYCDVSYSVSGKYLRGYNVDGVDYSHIIDGTTGAPSKNGIMSVSLAMGKDVAYSATKADCFTTALSVASLDDFVDFVNNYAQSNNIKVCASYLSQQGDWQLLSNLDKTKVQKDGTSFDKYAWALQYKDGKFVYDNTAVAPNNKDVTGVIGIILAVVIVALLVFSIVYFALRGKVSWQQKIVVAQKQKSFVKLDVAFYAALVVLIVVLFVVFIPVDNQIRQVNVVDMQTNEVLFSYNISTDNYNYNNVNGWNVEIQQDNGAVTVTLSKQINGQTHFNKLIIRPSSQTTVQMVDSLCGRHQDCVNVFSVVDSVGGVIVCSPNMIKVITK